MAKRKRRKKVYVATGIIPVIFLIIGLCITIVGNNVDENNIVNMDTTSQTVSYIDLSTIPDFDGENFAVLINNNNPYFTEADYTKEPFEKYSELDVLGRCGVAYANICTDIMPAKGEKRESISSITPTGWKQNYFDKSIVKGEHLYERCHLIGWQLAGENDNERNLITGTGYMNTTAMLPYENMVDDYIEENPNNHVLYRVTPIFEGNNLVANGVEMEAYSVEDIGQGVCFNVYCYNVQPGITINYETGDSYLQSDI